MAKNTAPQGFEYHYNPITGKTILRPIKGFSEEYLSESTFIPQREEVEVAETNEDRGGNTNLTLARINKNDEFYTRIEDIIAEMKHYKDAFKDKVVYCPCDKVFNLGRSEFFNYFANRFHQLGLKKLICTQYNPNGHGYKKEVEYSSNGIEWEYNGEYEDGTAIDESMVDTTFLKGNGSFDSEECIDLMKSADVVVTNPPFSLFRVFIKQMIDLDKKFIIIGSVNAITYKDIFTYIKNNQLWLGYGNVKAYRTSLKKIENEKTQYIENGVVYQKFGNTCWYTNIEHNKRKDGIYLSAIYSEEKYPNYDNFNAIEVGRVENIPCNYENIMGVPISFLDKYSPTQFEILGITARWSDMKTKEYSKKEYKNANDLNGSWVIFKDGVPKMGYKRLLIRKKISE